jgi:hypothetical protein
LLRGKLAREKGCSQTRVGEGIREGLIEFWRRNSMNYSPPLSADERRRKRLRGEERGPAAWGVLSESRHAA